MSNALLWEIKKFCPDEYQLGLDALEIIEQQTGIRPREDEAGFLATHIINAQYGSGTTAAQDMIRMIQDIVNLVRYTYGIDLDESSLYYIRFITHLKFFLARIVRKQAYLGSGNLYGIISVMYSRAAACVQKIVDDFRSQLDYSLSLEDEVFQRFVERYPTLKCIARHVRYAHSASENSLMAYMWYQGHTFESKLFTFNILDRTGGGDAFASGLIYAMMHGYKPMDMLNFAVASSVIKHTIRGDGNITDDVDSIRNLMNMNYDIKR